MRIILLSIFFILQLESSEVILSAVIGELISDVKPELADKLILNKSYKVPKNSKIQLIVNKSASITISQNSEFSITYIDKLTCKINIKSGTYKIFNLSSKDTPIVVEFHTSKNKIIIKDAIALIKISPRNLIIASAKNTLTLINREKKISILEDKMIKLHNNTFKIDKIIYDVFEDVFIKKDSSKVDKTAIQNSKIDDPANLDN